MQKFKKAIVYTSIFILLFFSFIFVMTGNEYDSEDVKLCINASYLVDDILEVYYSETGEFSEEESFSMQITGAQGVESYYIDLPENVNFIRIDWGQVTGDVIDISSLELYSGNQVITVDSEKFVEDITEFSNHTLIINGMLNGNARITLDSTDSYSVLAMEYFEDDLVEMQNPIGMIELGVAFLLAIGITGFIYKFVFLKEIYAFGRDLIRERKLIFSLASNDFKAKFAGSYFGIIWAFVQPMCTIAVFWFVFELGFRSGSVSDIPFALWLAVGLVPWFFFSDAWNGATNAFMEYNYLVKKVVFKIEILPIVKILSAFFVHLFFFVFLWVLFLVNGIAITYNIFGVFYYMLCLGVYVIGLSFVTSSIVGFFKDLTQIISIILQFGMWLVPIMWQQSTFDDRIITIMRMNPMFYIIEGYRSCFITSEPVPTVQQGVYFWLITVLIFLFGIALFRRLKPHFADVL